MKQHITEHTVHDQNDALLYMANCQLATVAEMALKKTRAKHEYGRQTDIAQLLVNWIQEFHIEVDSGNRVADVLALPSKSVKEWASKYES